MGYNAPTAPTAAPAKPPLSNPIIIQPEPLKNAKIRQMAVAKLGTQKKFWKGGEPPLFMGIPCSFIIIQPEAIIIFWAPQLINVASPVCRIAMP